MPKTAYRPAFVLFLACAALLGGIGCSSDPNTQAAELRALYKEAQFQSGEICKTKGVDPVKCADLQSRLNSLEPAVEAIEVAAAVATDNPGGAVNFQVLWASAKPKVEAILLEMVLKKYLGT